MYGGHTFNYLLDKDRAGWIMLDQCEKMTSESLRIMSFHLDSGSHFSMHSSTDGHRAGKGLGAEAFLRSLRALTSTSERVILALTI